jgi:hypothetical protein
MRRRRTLFCSVSIGLVCLLAGASSGSAAETAGLLRFHGVKGDSNLEGYEDWITAWGSLKPPDHGSRHVFGVHRSGEAGPLPDESSVALTNLHARGQPFDLEYTWLEIREDAAPVRLGTIRLTECLLERMVYGKDETPVTEWIEFRCAEYELVTHEP